MFIKEIFFTMQFLRFGIIGVLNTVIHGSILTALVECFSANVVLGNGVAFLMANLFSYFMNSYLVFKARPALFLYFKFLTASLLSFGLTLLIAAVMNYLGFHYLVGFLVIILTLPALSFIAMKFWAFSIRKA